MKTNVETIEKLYRIIRAKDYDAFPSVCAPDVEWIQNEGFPGGATRRGAQAVMDGVFRVFDSAWENWGFDIEHYLDAGDTVVVVGKYRGRYRASGKLFSASAAHVYDLKDGKISRFRQFADTKLVCDAMV